MTTLRMWQSIVDFSLLPQVLLIANKCHICSLGHLVMLEDLELFIILSHT